MTDKAELVSLKRLQQDWLSLPYQEIEIIAGNHCKKGWETLFSWGWEGTRSYCLADAGNINQEDDWTPETKMKCGSGLISRIKPVNVTKFEDHTICAKRGGTNFLHSTRPKASTGKCPGVLKSCSENTSPENTICKHPSKVNECPINFIKFANKTRMH